MGNEGLRALEGKAALFAATGQIQLLHAQTQLMELHLLQLVHGYASSVARFGLRRFVADELGLLLGMSSRSAKLLIEDAEMLIAHPVLMARVADGQWSLRHARAALGCLAGSGLDSGQQEQAVALVLSDRSGQPRTPWEVRKAMLAAILVIDPEAAARRHEKAVADRGVSMDATDGVGTLFAYGSVSQVRALMSALEAQVGPAGPEETRSRAQRLFDALMDAVCGRVEPTQWQAYVVMTLDALTGASEEPAEIPGLGLITAVEARDIAARAELRRVVVGEQGELVSIDTPVAKPDTAPASEVAAAATSPLVSLQVEEPADDTPNDVTAEVTAEDLAWYAAHTDAPTHLDAPTDPDLGDLAAACPQVLDSALEDLLSQALTTLILTGTVPAASVTFDTHSYGHHQPGPPGHAVPPGPSGPPGWSGSPPDPPDGPGPDTCFGPDPDPDTPPTPGDLAWADDTTDYATFDAQVPPRRYQREPGTRSGGAHPPTQKLWTPTGLTAALTRMLTHPVDTTPLASSSYALPPGMARFVKARDVRRVLGSDATPSTRRSCHQENQQARSAA